MLMLQALQPLTHLAEFDRRLSDRMWCHARAPINPLAAIILITITGVCQSNIS